MSNMEREREREREREQIRDSELWNQKIDIILGDKIE
jgi:hypothetical protein